MGPFIKLGPLRNVEGVAEIAGSLNGAAVVLLLTLALSLYGAVTFQSDVPTVRAAAAGLGGWHEEMSLGLRHSVASPSASQQLWCHWTGRGGCTDLAQHVRGWRHPASRSRKTSRRREAAGQQQQRWRLVVAAAHSLPSLTVKLPVCLTGCCRLA